MLTGKEIKSVALEYGRKWLFPDFTNKLTWSVAGLGTAVIVTPTPLKLIVYNWLIDSFNLNSGKKFTLAELIPDAADYWVGFALIVAALLHNVLYRYFVYKEKQVSLAVASDRGNTHDRALFDKFLEDFPSGSDSVTMLRHHDFANSFNINTLMNLDKFVDEWDTVEREFLNDELEEMRGKLWGRCREFNYKLSLGSWDINGGPGFTCIPDAYRGLGNWPDHVAEKIGELNKLASECYELYAAFVRFGRKTLSTGF
ncbi:hypothetical protein YA0001_09855 [Pseudomonas viridiflava]|uniref:hypothetical protein n=1 Tax=Pseudomonas viridiflava TaxID=33069 RepID=UPI0018E64643|nr:hypothetical protein [Pseudomonas viridiflava]MBI6575931.1 hypothetical protein [Pseudomonas viridiflava]MBI6606996.1 hypothetical protein [Pseudomonas viridiflava]MBI6638801.1 hypothetical protein [Pseudomonas viridiflava]MBI6867875.1 hypothetical protein [Pseudomonas viridiflava]MEE4068908.1 hypothetical protein [Pseudomonas viridiflava]